MNQNFKSTKAESNLAMCLSRELVREILSAFFDTVVVFSHEDMTSETVQVSEDKIECAVEIRGAFTMERAQYSRFRDFSITVLLRKDTTSAAPMWRVWYPEKIYLTLTNIRMELHHHVISGDLIPAPDSQEAIEAAVYTKVNRPDAPWKLLATPLPIQPETNFSRNIAGASSRHNTE